MKEIVDFFLSRIPPFSEPVSYTLRNYKAWGFLINYFDTYVVVYAMI